MEENNVYNEFDINERNANEYEADPSVFFNKTGNPFVGFMRFLKRKPVPPKEIDEQEMLQALSEHFSNRAEYGSKTGIQAGGVVVSALLLIVFLFMFKSMNVWLCLTLVLLSAISLAIFIVWNIKSSSALNKKDNKSYTIEEYKAHIIKKAIGDKVSEIIYEPYCGLPQSVYCDVNIASRGNTYHREDLITGKYNNVYFVQSDLNVSSKNTGSEQRRTFTHFSGRWIVIDYPKKFSGTVIVKDKDFVGISRDDLEVITLENLTFNEMFTVSTNDVQLGYYILTPQLVERFMELKQSSKGAIIACFKDGMLHIGIHNRENAFELDVNNLDIAKDTKSFAKDFSLVSKTIDILEVNNGFYAQSKTQPSQYQNYSNSTLPNNNSSSGIGIQGGRF
jgi:hypothetical protein